jgi:hypothetical protein
MTPKVFISYSWSSPSHQSLVKQWADQLVADGVDVVLDIYDLREGHDKYAFMERMVTDESVTHVLVVSDKVYAEKADKRKAGVGTESQIISREIYEMVNQSKFIPIACELDERGNPFLPTFLKSRIWIDFTTPEAANDNWEQLVRVLYGKPIHQKPTLGKPPVYIADDSASPASPAASKYNALKQAILHGKSGLSFYRSDFLDACISYADALRVRERPNVDSLGEKVLADCGLLKHVRNQIIDWILLESADAPANEFSEILVVFLERLRGLKSRPPEVNSWSDAWFEAHSVFVYETFLYIISALIKTNAFGVLHEIFTNHYLLPETDSYGENSFDKFDCFYGHSDTLQILASEGRRLLSPAAELIKRQADRPELPFLAIIEAELLIFMMILLTPGTEWYPGTLHYAQFRRPFPLFLRATQHKHFQKLALITGADNAEKMREAVKAGYERLGVERWHDFRFTRNFGEYMNLEKLDTLK